MNKMIEKLLVINNLTSQVNKGLMVWKEQGVSKD
jgi:hypothetical protein